mgnify:FL=1
MIVGVPREIKQDEYRVALIPVGAEELTKAGHRVLIEKNAGQGSGIPDEMYVENGAVIVETAEEIWAESELIIKVKEPQTVELPLMRAGQLVFTFFILQPTKS